MKHVVITIEDDEEIKWVGGILTKIKKNNEHKSIITDEVKSYEDACRVLNIEAIFNEPKPTMNLDGFNCEIPKNVIAMMKLEVIVKALNEGWISTEHIDNYWYYPCFKRFYKNMEHYCSISYESSISYENGNYGISYGDVGYGMSYSDYGYSSRLALKSRELAEYCGKQFIQLWANYLLG